jgi:uncharacterized protein (TIGR03435 family)
MNLQLRTLVVDETELKGAWDFDFKFTPRRMIRPAGPIPGSISLFEAIEKQLGLKLEAKKRPVPILVIDDAERKPTEN